MVTRPGERAVAHLQPAGPSLDLTSMYTCRAHVTLDVNHQQRAVFDLREELTLKVRATDPLDVPDWSTLSVFGPTESWGPQGQIHYEYQGTVRVRSRGERAVPHP